MSTDQTSTEVEQADGIAHESEAAVNSDSPGTRLAQQRQARGLSQKEVADKLHITIHYVNSIEHDAYEKLPGTVFAKGYIRRYAELLELDVEEYLQGFDQLQAEQKSGAEQEAKQRRRASGRRSRSIAVASMVLFVGLFVTVWYFTADDSGGIVESAGNEPGSANKAPAPERANSLAVLAADAVEQAPAVANSAEQVVEPAPESMSAQSVESPLATEPSQTPDESAVANPANQATAATVVEDDAASSNQQTSALIDDSAPLDDANSNAREPVAEIIPKPIAMREQAVSPESDERVITVVAEGDDILRISFSGESWVEVNDGSSNQIYRDLLEAGDILQITGEAPFNVLLGDAPFTELTFNGDEVDVSDNIRIDNSARLTVGL